MKRTVKISRPANGSGTIVTVTLVEDGITATYGYKSSATKIADSIEFCDRAARDMLKQARTAVDTSLESVA